MTRAGCMDSSNTGIGMDVSKKISVDIVKYLQKKKELSIDDIAKAMSTSPAHIQKILNKKSFLKSENINFYLKNKNQRGKAQRDRL